MERKELFIISDYETERPMNYYLTNNANGCYIAMCDIDGINEMDEEDNRELYEELGKETAENIIKSKLFGDWSYAFKELCEARNIEVEEIINPKEYMY